MKIIQNFLYNFIYQLLLLLLPLITAPYISRVIGSEGLGIYSYTFSIAYYFSLLLLLGVNNYGNRSIARVQKNPKVLTQTFCEIYTVQLIMSTVIISIYLCYVFFVSQRYQIYLFIQLIYLCSSALDINWFFFGIEKFKVTVYRNAIVKFATVISIFVFIKSINDLWKYALIMSCSFLLSQIILWLCVKRYIIKFHLTTNNIHNHLKAEFILFIPVIAVSIYTVLDKILLGQFSSIRQVGLYDNAEKIISVSLTIITALGTIMLPRITNLIAENKGTIVKLYIKYSMEYMMMLASAVGFGIAAIAPEFSIIFFGNEFKSCGLLITCLSPTIFFISWANVIRTQYLIPNNRDREYVASVMVGSFIDISANLILIKYIGALGAVIGTVLAEAAVAIYQTVVIRNELEFYYYFKKGLPYFLIGCFMYIIVRFIGKTGGATILTVVFEIVTGIIIYLSLSLIYMLITKNIFIQKFKKLFLSLKK